MALATDSGLRRRSGRRLVVARVEDGPGLGELLVHLWTLSRPRFWTVSVLPAYVGYVLATRELVPGLALWTRLWDTAARSGVTATRLLDTVVGWVALGADLLLGLVVLGPLLWTATLLINDAYDLGTDRRNPRKASSPLVQGIVDAGWARRTAHGFAAGALGLASLLPTSFLLLTAACLVLAWAYSVPPVRLKSRPGMDVAVNAIGIGVLAAMAGWSLAAPVGAFPFAFLPQGLLVAVSIYVPTTLADHAADAAAGERTLATALGPERAYQIGWWTWVASNAGALVLAGGGWLIPRGFLPVLVVFVPLLLWQYHTFIGQARDQAALVRGIFLCALTFLAFNLLFAFTYTGLLRI